jgi:hypothetical protein
MRRKYFVVFNEPAMLAMRLRSSRTILRRP